MRDPKVVVLVPLRLDEADPARAKAWDFTREHLESFGWPIYTADSVGPWKRAEAINRAAREADMVSDASWDIAVIADADTIHLPQDLRSGVVLAAKLQTLVIPWRTRWKLSQAGTQRFYEHGIPGYTAEDLDRKDRTRTRMPPKVRGGTTIVPRNVWGRVGGFDEGFVEWGHEDVAFRIAAATLTPGRINELFGTIWHLWHPRNINHDHRHDNDTRLGQYNEADGSKIRMLDLLNKLEVLPGVPS
jgi:GT2 family glycosyltransferase